MMRLAKNALMSALIMLAMLVAVSAQTPRSAEDNRNLAPAVGTGGTIGGPTGLFTVYDGATLRRGEYTFSAAYSNFDRDPGDVDITEVPISFQIGLNDYIELFFNTDAYRQVKVNSFRNLSSFYLPNSQFFNATLGRVAQPGAIVLAPQGPTTTTFAGTAVYRRAGAPFTQFPFVGGSFGNNGITAPPGVTLGSAFGFPAGTTPTLGAPISSGDGAALFPGVGSVYGSILPGVVLTTQTITLGSATGVSTTAPLAYSAAPSYLPDAPFINRSYGQTAFNTFTVGGKIRFTGPDSPYGVGVIPFYRFYADKADDFAGFNQLQRGASPGGNRGDFGLIGFADARLRQWLNVSVNVGYIYNSDVDAEFPSGKFTILDRPDELLYGAALDFPVNKYFQPIAEFRGTRYVGGRTPNAFENHPMDALAGVRIFPRRWFGMGFAYRYNINQQDEDALEDTTFSSSVNVVTPTGGLVVNNQTNRTAALGPDAFRRSSDPHGFIGQFFIGRRNSRGVPPPVNQVPNVTALNLDSTTVTIPCPPGTQSAAGCNDDASIAVSTVAVDPENDVLTYNYTVSGGRIVGSGANVNWDLTGVAPGTYTITSAVDDGCGVCGTTQTKTVTVAACADCRPICACPTLSVSGPSAAVRTGEAMTFTATVSGGSQTNVTYNWTVSAGSITSGQGTPSITVDTTGLSGQTVTATVQIGGDLCAECDKEESASGIVEERVVPTFRKIDEFGALQNDDIKARLDPFAVELQNDPAATGTIINYGTPAQVRRREALMRTYLTRNRGVDASRLNFVNGGTGDIKTELYVVPAGATQPTPGQ